MPVTPFHGGFGLFVKGAANRQVSFILFCCTQVVIDLESGYFLLKNEWPVHRFLHTFMGATLVSTAVVFALRPVTLRVLRYCEQRPVLSEWFDLTPAISWQVALTSAILGVVAHIIPDGIMHYDVEPFAPFSRWNPFYQIVSLGVLHVALVIAGFAGFVLLAFSRHHVDAG